MAVTPEQIAQWRAQGFDANGWRRNSQSPTGWDEAPGAIHKAQQPAAQQPAAQQQVGGPAATQQQSQSPAPGATGTNPNTPVAKFGGRTANEVFQEAYAKNPSIVNNDAWRAWCQKYGVPLNTGGTAQTPSGGGAAPLTPNPANGVAGNGQQQRGANYAYTDAHHPASANARARDYQDESNQRYDNRQQAFQSTFGLSDAKGGKRTFQGNYYHNPDDGKDYTFDESTNSWNVLERGYKPQSFNRGVYDDAAKAKYKTEAEFEAAEDARAAQWQKQNDPSSENARRHREIADAEYQRKIAEAQNAGPQNYKWRRFTNGARNVFSDFMNGRGDYGSDRRIKRVFKPTTSMIRGTKHGYF